jgi:hypothetical protein
VCADASCAYQSRQNTYNGGLGHQLGGHDGVKHSKRISKHIHSHTCMSTSMRDMWAALCSIPAIDQLRIAKWSRIAHVHTGAKHVELVLLRVEPICYTQYADS